MLEKSEGTIKNEQSRDTGRNGHKTRNGDKQKKKKKKKCDTDYMSVKLTSKYMISLLIGLRA